MAHIDPLALQDLKARTDIVELIGRVTKLRRVGSTHRGPCPWCGGSDKATKFEVLPARRTFKCHECGNGGDVLEFLKLWDGLDFAGAVDALGGARELTPADRKKLKRKQATDARQEAKRRDKALAKARGIWDASVPGAGSLAEAYLRFRGIDVEHLPYGWPKALRLHEALDYWHQPVAGKPEVLHCGPAVIAAIVGPDDGFLGAHCTWIRADGRGKMKFLDRYHTVLKSKKIQGFQTGGAIRLTPRAPHLVIGEGYETTLSALYALSLSGKGRDYAAWCGVSLGNMSGAGLGPSTVHPSDPKKRVPSRVPDLERPGLVVPNWAYAVTFLGDGDSDRPITSARMACAAHRATRGDRAAFIAWADDGKDFNDMLVGR